jgi:hypothetical protein
MVKQAFGISKPKGQGVFSPLIKIKLLSINSTNLAGDLLFENYF